MTAADSVLVLCGGRWVGMVLQLRRAMRQVAALRHGRLLVADQSEVTPGGCFADGAFVVPPIDDPAYPERLVELAEAERTRVVVPLIDLDLERLAPFTDRFAAVGAALVCPPPDLVELCLDKDRFATFAAEEGLPHPRQYALTDLVDHLYPVFAKRRRGFGSIGATICRTRQEAESTAARLEDTIFQEYIHAPEVSVDAFIAPDGRCSVRVPRLRDKVVGGEAWRSHTLPRGPATDLADRTIGALAARGLRGPLNVQVFLTDPPVLIEVNTRLGSASVLSNVAAGGRLLASVLAMACGESQVGDPDDYRVGLHLYRFVGDVFYDADGAVDILPAPDGGAANGAGR